MAFGIIDRDRNVSDECLDEIVDVLKSAGHRMTGDGIATTMHRLGVGRCGSVLKHTLSYFRKLGRLTNDPKADPPGYGLPEWDATEGGQP